MNEPRITPGGLSELGLVNWALCRMASRVAGTRDVNLFSTLGRQRRLFRGWMLFAARMMPGGTLDRLDSEVTILRVAHVRQCRYELDHHLRISRRVGVDGALADQVFLGPRAPGLSDRHRALLAAVDSLLHARNIDDDGWRKLRAHYSERQLIELCLLVGHYDMLATTLATLRVARDCER